MDSIIGDKFVNGRRLRLATLEYASEQFPRLIYELKTNKLQISVTKILDGNRVVTLYNPNNRRDKWIILESDFIKCRDIAGRINIPMFPADTHKMTLNKILALVQLEWAGQGVPT